MSRLLLAFVIGILTMQSVVPDLPLATSTPDHFFYGLDRALENFIELPFARLFGIKALIRKRLVLAEERLSEMNVMANEGKAEYVSQLVDDYENGMNKAMQLVEQQDVVDLCEDIAERSMWHITILEEVRMMVPEYAHFGIDIVIEHSSSRVLDARERGIS